MKKIITSSYMPNIRFTRRGRCNGVVLGDDKIRPRFAAAPGSAFLVTRTSLIAATPLAYPCLVMKDGLAKPAPSILRREGKVEDGSNEQGDKRKPINNQSLSPIELVVRTPPPN